MSGQQRWGGKGVRIDYRIKSDNAWLTVAYTRDKVPPWPLKGGQPGSPNHVLIRRANGETERYAVTSGLILNTDDVIQVMTGTGAGWGDPLERPLDLEKEDLKNGYITLEQAKRYYFIRWSSMRKRGCICRKSLTKEVEDELDTAFGERQMLLGLLLL